MGYNFPDAPTLNQVFGNYTWDGEKWSSGTGYGAIYASDSAPAAPPGSLWYETDTGMLFFRWNDGTSTQWIAIPGGVADAVRYSMPQNLTSAQASQARANIWVTKKNYIINGGMMVSQENGSTIGSAASTYYPVDNFWAVALGTTGIANTYQLASATPGGSTNRISIYVATVDAAVAGGDLVYLITAIEGLRAADLKSGTANAKTVTLQFGVKAPAGVYCITIRNGTSGVNRSYTTEYVIAAGEANIDVIKSVVIPLDTAGTWATNNTASMTVTWALMCGTTYQLAANTWTAGNLVATANQFNFMGTNGNVFELFDVSLTEGSVAPPFQLPDYADELVACQRYYEITMATSRFPATVANQNKSTLIVWRVIKRNTPILTLNAGSRLNFTTVTTEAPNVYGARHLLTSAAAGDCYALDETVRANARL